MSFWKMVAAYLTGWLIARATFLRAIEFVTRSDARRYEKYIREQAIAIADEIDSRRESRDRERDLERRRRELEGDVPIDFPNED